jgi:exonuclease III
MIANLLNLLCVIVSVPALLSDNKLCVTMNEPVQNDLNLLQPEINVPSFPKITISSVNCNSLNMATTTKHVRMRKFYGICSLKTDIIFLSDLRLCNKSGATDMKFVNKIFAVNPYCSYRFFSQSTKNCRGVGILVKKSLNFVCLDTERDLLTDNFLLLRATLQNQTVIIGAIYGPNKRDDDFYDRLNVSLERLGDVPIILGGDWNATFSCLPVLENPDILFMQDVPNSAHSKKIREICNRFELYDPFRTLFPNRKDFSYSPWGTLRKNRSRLDFFLVSKNIMGNVEECYISNNTLSKLFDHKAIFLSFNKAASYSNRPTISNAILRDPDLDFVVKLASLECYGQCVENEIIRENTLRQIGTCFKKLRDMGPDPEHIEYAHADLMDVDVRTRLRAELRLALDELDELNLPAINTRMEEDEFLELMINNIRNEVISYQSFISKTINISYKKLTEKIVDLKVLSNHLKGGWRVYSFNPCC